MDQDIRLLPTRTVFAEGEPVNVEIRNATGRAELTVLHWGEPVTRVEASVPGLVDLGRLPAGGYGVEARIGEGVVRTAVDVSTDPTSRCRYGFVVDYRADRDPSPVADNLRQLHLTDVEFYDWAYRHADLLGGGDTYAEPLGQPVSLRTVRRLIRTCHEVGSRALGYAAVYAVGNDEWPDWQKAALLTASGVAYGLGDFLSIVDPADAEWLAHFIEDLNAALREVGFDGYRLDQFGYPKRALRPDGSVVDLAERFATLLAEVRSALPSSKLVFNNVNNFPVWRTAYSPVNVVYIEVWPPHTTLAHLARLAREAVREAAGKPVVLAAYQHVYDTALTTGADLATAFTMATVFSHGATHVLCGEADRILVDPYYVRNHLVEPSTASMLRRWYDFLVEHIELLQHPTAVDVTGSLAGDYNGECDVTYDGTAVSDQPTASTVWRRIVDVDDRLVMHLINLVGQDDTAWDSARNEPTPVSGGTLRARRLGKNPPRVRVADPDRQPHLTDVAVAIDGDYIVAALPPLGVWQLLVIDL